MYGKYGAMKYLLMVGLPQWLSRKESICDAGDAEDVVPRMEGYPGAGHGNPLQCSCLENPRDSGAWWAAIYGVTQSWTRLKQLSSKHQHIKHL